MPFPQIERMKFGQLDSSCPGKAVLYPNYIVFGNSAEDSFLFGKRFVSMRLRLIFFGTKHVSCRRSTGHELCAGSLYQRYRRTIRYVLSRESLVCGKTSKVYVDGSSWYLSAAELRHLHDQNHEDTARSLHCKYYLES